MAPTAGLDRVAKTKIPTSAKNIAPAAKPAVNFNETTNFPGLSLWSPASAVSLTVEQVPTAGILVPIDKTYAGVLVPIDQTYCRSSGTY